MPCLSVAVAQLKYRIIDVDLLYVLLYPYLETLLEQQGRSIQVINLAEDAAEELLSDLTAIICSFCARLYGQRRAKRKTERLKAELPR